MTGANFAIFSLYLVPSACSGPKGKTCCSFICSIMLYASVLGFRGNIFQRLDRYMKVNIR